MDVPAAKPSPAQRFIWAQLISNALHGVVPSLKAGNVEPEWAPARDSFDEQELCSYLVLTWLFWSKT